MLRRRSIDGVHAVIGSYNQSESVLGTSPPSSLGASPSSRIGDGEFSEDSVNWIRRSNSGKLASSVPAGGFNWTVKKAPAVSGIDSLPLLQPLFLFYSLLLENANDSSYGGGIVRGRCYRYPKTV